MSEIFFARAVGCHLSVSKGGGDRLIVAVGLAGRGHAICLSADQHAALRDALASTQPAPPPFTLYIGDHTNDASSPGDDELPDTIGHVDPSASSTYLMSSERQGPPPLRDQNPGALPRFGVQSFGVGLPPDPSRALLGPCDFHDLENQGRKGDQDTKQ